MEMGYRGSSLQTSPGEKLPRSGREEGEVGEELEDEDGWRQVPGSVGCVSGAISQSGENDPFHQGGKDTRRSVRFTSPGPGTCGGEVKTC